MTYSIIGMHHFTLLMILGTRFVLPPTVPTHWLDGYSEQWTADDNDAPGLFNVFFCPQSLSQQGKKCSHFTNVLGNSLQVKDNEV
jgi:hypothetical protein